MIDQNQVIYWLSNKQGKKLNTYRPQPDFVYTFDKEGKEIYIKLDNLPRLGGIDKKRKMIGNFLIMYRNGCSNIIFWYWS